MSITRPRFHATQPEQRLASGLARFLLAGCVLGALFAGLFPFDFSIPREVTAVEKIRRDFDRSPEPPVLEDRITNILFFVPVGFCIAAAVRVRRNRAPARLGAALAGGAALSSVIEVGQVFLGFRDPTWSDVMMNTIGSVIGAGAFLAFGDRALELAASQLAPLHRFATARTLGVCAALWGALVCCLPLLMRDRGSLRTWESAYPLLIGNERNRERPWRGNVRQLILAARAIRPDEVKHLLAGEGASLFGDALLGDYDLTGIGPYRDRLKLLPELQWDGGPPEDQTAGRPARVSDNHWLRTSAALAPASARIRNSSEFTIAIVCSSNDLSLNGPGRIASISINTGLRNLMIGQEADHLAVRLRTSATGENGTSPQVEVAGVFTDESERQIVVTYKDTVLIAYVDGEERGRIEITPEAAVIWKMYPRGVWRIMTDQVGFRSYAAVYRAMAFVPFAALLVAAVSMSRLNHKQRLLSLACATVAAAVVLELVIGSLMTSGFRPRNLLISVVISGVTIGAILLLNRSRKF